MIQVELESLKTPKTVECIENEEIAVSKGSYCLDFEQEGVIRSTLKSGIRSKQSSFRRF